MGKEDRDGIEDSDVGSYITNRPVLFWLNPKVFKDESGHLAQEMVREPWKSLKMVPVLNTIRRDVTRAMVSAPEYGGPAFQAAIVPAIGVKMVAGVDWKIPPPTMAYLNKRFHEMVDGQFSNYRVLNMYESNSENHQYEFKYMYWNENKRRSGRVYYMDTKWSDHVNTLALKTDSRTIDLTRKLPPNWPPISTDGENL